MSDRPAETETLTRASEFRDSKFAAHLAAAHNGYMAACAGMAEPKSELDEHRASFDAGWRAAVDYVGLTHSPTPAAPQIDVQALAREIEQRVDQHLTLFWDEYATGTGKTHRLGMREVIAAELQRQLGKEEG